LFFNTVIKNTPEITECVLTFVQEGQVCPVQALLELRRRVCEKKGNVSDLFWTEDYTAPLGKVQLERNMRKLMKDAGIPEQYTPYSIKHAAITHLLAHDVQEWVVNRNARLSQFTNTATRHYFIGQANLIASKAIATAGSRVVEIDSLSSLDTSQQLTQEIATATPVGPTEEEEEEEKAGTEEEQEEETEAERKTVDTHQQMILPTMADALVSNDALEWSSRYFDIQNSDWDGIQTIPSVRLDEKDIDFSLFSLVCSMLSPTTSGSGTSARSPSGRRGCEQRGRGQLAQSVCSSHAGHRSHSPDPPPLSPNSGSLSQ
jgi:hypothetical protein